MSSQFSLLTQRRFLPLFATQFLGAMNDNLFKFGFTLLVTYGPLVYPEGVFSNRYVLENLIGAIFILPFLLICVLLLAPLYLNLSLQIHQHSCIFF